MQIFSDFLALFDLEIGTGPVLRQPDHVGYIQPSMFGQCRVRKRALSGHLYQASDEPGLPNPAVMIVRVWKWVALPARGQHHESRITGDPSGLRNSVQGMFAFFGASPPPDAWTRHHSIGTHGPRHSVNLAGASLAQGGLQRIDRRSCGDGIVDDGDFTRFTVSNGRRSCFDSAGDS